MSPVAAELADLGQELRDGEGGGGDRGVAERVNHDRLSVCVGNELFYSQNYADFADNLLLIYAAIPSYR